MAALYTTRAHAAHCRSIEVAAGAGEAVGCSGGGSDLARVGEDVRLAQLRVGASQVLLSSPSMRTIALVGLQPVLPGHVVVTPRREAARLADLTEEELLDFWRTVLAAELAAELQQGASASNIAVSDGRAAGQAVPQLHAHVVPRRPRDLLENDAVYEALETWEPAPGVAEHSRAGPAWPTDADRRPRTLDEMAAEAALYRAPGTTVPAEQAFARFRIDGSCIFHASISGLTVAFVNLKPLVPGHVLVTPRRVVARLRDLSDDELADLFLTVRSVQEIVEIYYGAKASRLGIQDGQDAGQTVPHVHVHVLPMR